MFSAGSSPLEKKTPNVYIQMSDTHSSRLGLERSHETCCWFRPGEQWKKGRWLFRGFVGDEILPSYVGIIINHEIRIPI